MDTFFPLPKKNQSDTVRAEKLKSQFLFFFNKKKILNTSKRYLEKLNKRRGKSTRFAEFIDFIINENVCDGFRKWPPFYLLKFMN